MRWGWTRRTVCSPPARFRLAVNASRSVDAVLIRPSRGHADLVYRLEGCVDPRTDSWLTLPLAPAVEPEQ